MKKIYLFIFLLMFVASVVNAATYFSRATGVWNINTTWSLTSGGVAVGVGVWPVAGDVVNIEGGFTVTINANVACATLNVGTATAGTLTIGDNNTDRSVTVSGNITIASTGIFQSAGNGGNTVLIGGNLTNSGTFDMNTAGDADVTFNGAANQTISGAGGTTDFNAITLNNSGAASNNIVEFTSSNFANTALTLTDGILKFSTPNTLTAASLTLGAAVGIIINHASAILNNTNDYTVAGGDFQLLAGTWSNGNGNDDFIISSGTATFTGGTLNVFGHFQMTGGTTTINGATINIDPQQSNNLGSTIHLFEATGAANVTFTSGTVTIIDPHSATGTGNAVQIVVGGTKDFNGGTIRLGDGTSTTAGSTEGFDVNAGVAVNLGNLIVNNPSGTNRFAALVTNDYEATGSITITAGELRSNTFDITLTGNWTNNGTFTQGTDLVTFNGAAAQTIGGTVATTFSGLTINNTSGGVSLSQDVFVTGIMTFTNGIVTSTTANLLTLNSAATVAGTPSNTKHVNGPIQKIGSGAFTFPVGKGGLYSPISITAPGEAGDAFQAEYRRESGTALGGIAPALSGLLFRVSNCDYWDLDEIADPGNNNSIDVTAGWFSGSTCGGFLYVTNVAGITLAHFDEGGTNLWNTIGGTGTGSTSTGTVTRTAVTTFSPFALGSTVDDANPLPVNLSNIRAFEKQQGIQIDWTAYQEQNLSHYSVERSADGITFTSIGQVASLNSATEKRYGFFDASPLAGVNFYRLRTNDIDGKFGYSAIVKVNLDRSVKDISLYPNPATGGFISFQGADFSKGNYSVKVYNSAGIQVMGQTFTHTGGAISQTLKLPNGIKSGMYSLQLVSDGVKLMSKSFIIQ